MDRNVEAAIYDLLDAGRRSVSPEEVARAVEGEGWRRVLPRVRSTAVALAREGRLNVLRHGRRADPDSFKGVYRLARPDVDG